MIAYIVIVALLLIGAGYGIGRGTGIARGKDIGWNDREYKRLQDELQRDRARRNRLGQFKWKGVES